MVSRILLLVSLALCLALSGCIEGEEQIWLRADGSGRIEARYKMPSAVAKRIGEPAELVRALQEAAERDPHVEITDLTYTTEGGGITLTFSGTFDSLNKLTSFPQRQLRDASKPDKRVQAEVLFGESAMVISDDNITYNREVDISWLLQSNPATKSIAKMPALFGKSSLTFILNLPGEAQESNASSQSEDKLRLEWNFLLKENTTGPMPMTARAALPASKPPWLFLLAILPLVFLVQNMRNRKKVEG
ncbi:MAG: hypothetical protein CMP30_09370 [Roseibacillus sp.]|nr:hypothetical protein [Roseibacillus sp.]